MVGVRTIWGIHMEWDDAMSPQNTKDIAIGWAALGDLDRLFSFAAMACRIMRTSYQEAASSADMANGPSTPEVCDRPIESRLTEGANWVSGPRKHPANLVDREARNAMH